jgi:hypothetical protein
LERPFFVQGEEQCKATKIVQREGFQGLRSVKKRSILSVCEHFEHERNAEITSLYGFLEFEVYGIPSPHTHLA